jgi:hypothetical protein
VKHGGGLAVAVDVGEGCAIDAMINATVFIVGITNALDLLRDSKRIVGTLRTEGDGRIYAARAGSWTGEKETG